jgi:hypothetical protein
MLAIVAFTDADEPWPMSTIAMTAATPITMPSVVSAERMTLRRNARMATRSVLKKAIGVMNVSMEA